MPVSKAREEVAQALEALDWSGIIGLYADAAGELLRRAAEVVRTGSWTPVEDPLSWPTSRPHWVDMWQLFPCRRCGQGVDDVNPHRCRPSTGQWVSVDDHGSLSQTEETGR